MTIPPAVHREAGPDRSSITRVEVDLEALGHNARVLGRMAAPAAFSAAVKKDGYGLGAVPIAHRLVKSGARMLCVYSPEEAEQLVLGAIQAPILILMPVWELSRTDALYRAAVAGRLHLTIHEKDQFEAVAKLGRTFGMQMPVQLYVDTGMSRGGLSPEQFGDVLRAAAGKAYVKVAGVYTHFASADTDPGMTLDQHERLAALLEEHAQALPDDALVHAAATTGVLRDPRYRLDMVRCGIGVFGYGPERMSATEDSTPLDTPEPLQHAVRWVSRVVHVQRYARRTPVGYNATHKLKRDSIVGVVPIGYGDGYPISLTNKGQVYVAPRDGRPGGHCKVLGKVNMDQITIDLTDLVDDTASAELGPLRDAEVELYANRPGEPNSVPQVAALAKSSSYELLCRLNAAMPRKFLHA
ncbi:MAG: alanine racemase [Planctomycetota bacterium]